MSSPYAKTISIFLIAIGLLLLLLRFFTTSDIGNASTYIGAVFTAFGFLVMMQSNKKSEEIQNLAVTPELTFTLYDPSIEMPDRFSNSVKVVNFTDAPALNLIIRFKKHKDDDYSRWVTCFTLPAQSREELFWLKFPDVIQVAYHDRQKKNFFVTTFHDSQPIPKRITKKEYDGYAAEGIANRNGNHGRLRSAFNDFIRLKLVQYNDNIHKAVADYNEFYDRELS